VSIYQNVLNAKPFIVTQPVSQTNLVGTTATFSVVAAGSTPLSYQWSFNGTNIVGATNSSLVLANVQFDQAGNYAVAITNAYGVAISSNAVLTVVPPPACAPAPSGLVSWWPGEGNANDVVGTNNGIAQNILYTNGEVGQAFVFNGSSSQIRVPASASLNVGTNNMGLTLEAWIKPASTTLSNVQSFIEWNQGTGSGGGPIGMHMGISGGFDASLFANLIDTSLAAHYISSVGGVITTNFQHVALTYDKNTGKAVLYRDGVVVASAEVGTNFIPRTDIDLYLGVRPAGSFANHFNGELDEVSIYNRPLSSSEIAAIYNAGDAGKCPLPLIILVQPTNQTVFVGDTAAFSVKATGSAPLFYQWSFNGTNIVGATNAWLTLTNVQFSKAGNYAVLVVNPAGSVLSSNALLVVKPPLHFVWDAIPSPRFTGVPFTVVVQAQNPTNGLAADFTNTVMLLTTNGVAVNPEISGHFIQGVWTGAVTIAQTGTNLVLEAGDNLGETGLANPINVVNLPPLASVASGTTLYVFWPVNPPGFVLETSPDLSPGSWTPVATTPVRIGDQNVEAITVSATNAFYRLHFIGP
jgi:Concanavalin A-like lectin/glucanases superfamily/Immunoglobulin domain